MKSLLIVGEAGWRSGIDPASCTGARLGRLLGAEDVNDVAAFVNLLSAGEAAGGWDRRLAAERADSVAWSLRGDPLPARRAVLLGARVAAAFGLGGGPCWKMSLAEVGGVPTLLLPHPSGRCRWWNTRANVLAAERALRRVLAEATEDSI